MMRKFTFKEALVIAIIFIILSFIIPVIYFYAGILTLIALNIIFLVCGAFALLLIIFISVLYKKVT